MKVEKRGFCPPIPVFDPDDVCEVAAWGWAKAQVDVPWVRVPEVPDFWSFMGKDSDNTCMNLIRGWLEQGRLFRYQARDRNCSVWDLHSESEAKDKEGKADAFMKVVTDQAFELDKDKSNICSQSSHLGIISEGSGKVTRECDVSSSSFLTPSEHEKQSAQDTATNDSSADSDIPPQPSILLMSSGAFPLSKNLQGLGKGVPFPNRSPGKVLPELSSSGSDDSSDEDDSESSDDEEATREGEESKPVDSKEDGTIASESSEENSLPSNPSKSRSWYCIRGREASFIAGDWCWHEGSSNRSG